LPESTGVSPHRPGQGMYARGAAAAALLLVALFASWRLYFNLIAFGVENYFELLGMKLRVAALWSGLLFIVLGAVTFLFTFAVGTGWQALDSKTRASVDLLIDTEGELSKVSWPGRDELLRATSAVLILIVIVGGFLLGVDWFVTRVLGILNVLPK
jgi:preprotein translocase SecE subunit